MHDRPLEYRPHPWHGVDPGKRFPEIVRAYIEIVPTDGVKYEIDKHSGYLMVDRPQRFSSFCPTLYGFVPRTYCGDRVAAYALAGSPPVSQGDGDPLDICVLTDRPISRGETGQTIYGNVAEVFCDGSVSAGATRSFGRAPATSASTASPYRLELVRPDPGDADQVRLDLRAAARPARSAWRR